MYITEEIKHQDNSNGKGKGLGLWTLSSLSLVPCNTRLVESYIVLSVLNSWFKTLGKGGFFFNPFKIAVVGLPTTCYSYSIREA